VSNCPKVVVCSQNDPTSHPQKVAGCVPDTKYLGKVRREDSEKVKICYLVGDFDEQCKNYDDKEVIKNTDSSNDEVNHLDHKFTDVVIKITIIFHADFIRQRCVLHRC